MLILVRIVIFLVSIMGYIFAAQYFLKLASYFSYIFVLSSMACIIFFSGMMNFLLPCTYTVFGIGLLLFIYFLFSKKLSQIIRYKSITLMNISFMMGSLIILASLFNTKFVHYDNFSHWGIVLKYMLYADAFPNASSALIEFVDYPLGSSSFIYYICKIIGNEQWVMLVGQALVILACFYAFFGIIKEKKRFLLYTLLAVVLCTMSFFNLSTRINNLLVDFLLPVLALSAIATIYSYREALNKVCIVIVPILGLLVVVKNTGIFFAATCYCYLIYTAINQQRQQHINIKPLLYSTGSIIVSILPLIAWKTYFNSVFQGVDTKFNMSQNNIVAVTSEKTSAQIKDIIHIFLTTIMDLKNPATFAFLAANVIAIIIFFVAKAVVKKKWNIVKVLIYTDVITAIYYIGILGMYIFLMPLDEALRIAGFERYVSSVVIYQIGWLAMCITLDVERSFHIQMGNVYHARAFKSIYTKGIYQKTTIVCFILSLFILTSEINGLNYIKMNYQKSVPGRVYGLIGENKKEIDNSKYLIYGSDTDSQISSWYLQYVGRYMLFAPNVEAIYEFNSETFLETLRNYDYFIVFESDNRLRQFMNKNFDIKVSEGIYSVKQDLLLAIK